MRFETGRFFIIIFILGSCFFTSDAFHRIDNLIYPTSAVDIVQQADAEEKKDASFIVSLSKIKKTVKTFPLHRATNLFSPSDTEKQSLLPPYKAWTRPNYYTMLFLYSLF